jgi:flagellar basal-body rod protein FlgB
MALLLYIVVWRYTVRDTMINLFGESKVRNLEKALQTYSLRHKAIASNIANVTTPGYKKVEVSFEDKLASEMNNTKLTATVTDENHLAFGTQSIADVDPEVVESETSKEDEFASGYNNVDIDQEMTLLAQNQLQYRMATRMITREFKGIQSAIKGQAQ